MFSFEQSRLDFLRRDFTTEVLKAVGKKPKLREEIIILVTWEQHWKEDSHSLVWIGSRAQVKDSILLITSQMASSDIRSKDDIIDGGPWTGRCQGILMSVFTMLALVETIFCLKNEANFSHLRVEFEGRVMDLEVTKCHQLWKNAFGKNVLVY